MLHFVELTVHNVNTVSYTHLDVYKRQSKADRGPLGQPPALERQQRRVGAQHDEDAAALRRVGPGGRHLRRAEQAADGHAIDPEVLA